MKTWLKGGIWGVGLYAILIILSFITIWLNFPTERIGYSFLIILLFANMKIIEPFLMNCTGGESCMGYGILLSLIPSLIEFFVIGAIIGLIYGEFKGAKK